MSSTVGKPFPKLLAFLARLDQGKVWYRLEHVRDSIMVLVTVPGVRWEVEFFEDGTVEVECFRSTGKIEGEEVLELLTSAKGDDRVAPTDTAAAFGAQASSLLAAARPISKVDTEGRT